MKTLTLSKQGDGNGSARNRDVKVLQVEALTRRTLVSAGASSYDYWTIGPVFEGLGPKLDKAVAHIVCNNRSSANILYLIRIQYSYNGLDWITGGNVLPAQSAEGYTVGADYSTRTDFGIFTRFQIGVSDAGAQEQGTFSVTLALKLWT